MSLIFALMTWKQEDEKGLRLACVRWEDGGGEKEEVD